MNLQDVIKTFGKLPEAKANITYENKKGIAIPLLSILLIGSIAYIIYQELEQKKKRKKY